MTRVRLRLAGAVLFALLSGCGAHLPAVPFTQGDLSIRVVDHGNHTERVLKAGSTEAQRFTKWLDKNASGWRRYYVTTPSDGIFVSTKLGYLQFGRNSVIAMRKEGTYAKQVSEDIYSLLRGE